MKKNNEFNKIITKQNVLNRKLALKLEDLGIKNFNITSLGNSIATGYSMVRITKPLLMRNEYITRIFTQHEINLNTYHFTRAQNNSDEHIFDWIISNIKQSEINTMNRSDFSGSKSSMSTRNITLETLDEYYPTNLDIDKGLQDILLSAKASLGNIVVYNGCTGSFLDNWTRGGGLSKRFTYGVKRDIKSLEATLKFIHLNNRNNHNINTQVYLCGVPNYLGLGITSIINNKLKNVAKDYPNVTYVEPVKSNFFYEEYDLKLTDAKTKKGKKVDIHYDELEYLKFLNNVLTSIIDNFDINRALINIDRSFYKYSSNLELETSYLLDCHDKKIDNMECIIEKELNCINSENKKKLFKDLKTYIKAKFPYDFYYLGKDNIKESLKKVKKKER